MPQVLTVSVRYFAVLPPDYLGLHQRFEITTGLG
jgi:hypothetical protein